MSTIHRSFKIRAYPTQEQSQRFAHTEGACRFLRRKVFEAMDRYHEATVAYKTIVDMSRALTRWTTTEDMAQPERLPRSLPKMITLSLDAAGRYFISFGVEVEMESLPLTGVAVGVDLGIKDLAVLSDGDKIPNAKALKGRERYLKRQQRALSRKVGSKQGEKKSKRYLKQQRRVAKIYARITDIRKDHAHKASIAIVRKADVIALEDLHVRGMVKNHRLAKAVSDSGFRMLRTQIEYKAGWYGREVLIGDRFAPTSKQCACCGYIMNEMPLSVREWDCPQCGTHHALSTPQVVPTKARMPRAA